ncbi:DUF1957 domain-containing protein [Synechococcus sp. CS-602]|uniref:1,4-alpha-glucan branching protein domain-containing protein n=1 Tax=Synechococcaceae TaxID=1890426 RepID=UPI0008FF6331|nr:MULTISPECIES: 1,4-alpha-glucan branching protein domain-containing protein [Synechococcaceae]MCT4365479.1 DUF1957 domain-containing protein [Candidatus Regnicoccus frigidus MAG-AL1]APD47493.1 glycoside hydrolase family 57 [Synechococcus sp. SynAce01]MCT0202546.1 DUF1957 domain-containing protein [Synechococcus sp. CS-603]MCT0204350.1 DUF1957 domain-containing protein [Synechococcus sp. CS-602]MCT0247192.1 DUF1957 domain-containing protein [Synechococcus sp. CS-601]
MAAGELALVLHAHLPYVRSSQPGSLEQDWFFQAVLECYLPLLRLLEVGAAGSAPSPQLSLGLSPTLLSLLSDRDLHQQFPVWIQQRQTLLASAHPSQQLAAVALAEQLQQARSDWPSEAGELLARFRQLQQAGVLDLMTCAATHGYLPLLRQTPEAVQAQLLTAIREHERLLGERPLGIWLPECAYYEGLDQQLASCGLRYAVLDGHGLLHGLPRPRYGIYAPICSPAGVAFFGRDGNTTLPVWSASEGYPGDGAYREFHRDLGWDLPESDLQQLGIPCSRPLALKLHRVTGQGCPLDLKQPYEPELAKTQAAEHAADYISGRLAELRRLEEVMDRPPLLVAPFDAELFGHWWYEGPTFLAEVFSQGAAAGLRFTSLKGVLAEARPLQICRPSPSSWGQGGYHHYWLNPSNAWVVPEWERASAAMVKRVNSGVTSGKTCGLTSAKQERILTQAGRELLLAQSSDWSFILRAGTTTELARDRILSHLDRFWRLLDALETGTEPPSQWLAALESEDRIFPLLNSADWATAALPSAVVPS